VAHAAHLTLGADEGRYLAADWHAIDAIKLLEFDTAMATDVGRRNLIQMGPSVREWSSSRMARFTGAIVLLVLSDYVKIVATSS
jgi:hypothetical protein